MDQLRWGINILGQRQVLGCNRRTCRALALRQANTNSCCPVISCRMRERVFMLPIDDGKSIYVTYFKHLTLAVISQLMTAPLKAGCARTGTNIPQMSLKVIWGQVFFYLGWGFFSEANFSVRSIQSIPSCNRRITRTWTDKCPRLHCCGKMVCQTLPSGITVGSELGAAHGQKLTERGVQPPGASVPTSASGRWLQSSPSPFGICWAFAGPSIVPSHYCSWCTIKKISYHSGFQY